MSTPTEFDAYARSYDLLYGDKDYAAEAAFVDAQIQRHCPGARRVLELGCGTGGHAFRLVEFGYELHGVDLSPRMLAGAEAARRSLPPAQAARLRFEEGDIRQLRLGQQFDAVISLFHVMSYQTSDDDLAQALATAVSHLRPGGVLLFDFWYGPAVLRDPPSVRIKRVEDDALRVTRLAEPVMHHERNVVNVDYHLFVEDKVSQQIEQVLESHAMRYWFWPELQRHLRMAGLSPLGLWPWMEDREMAGPQHWQAYAACLLQSPDT